MVGALLRQAGHNVAYLAPAGGSGRALAGAGCAAGRRPPDEAWALPDGNRPVWRALRRRAKLADVIHAHGLKAGALAVLAARGRCPRHRPRVVVTVHNRPVGGRRVRWTAGLLARLVARADVVLGVSSDTVDWLRARGASGAQRALVPAPRLAPARQDPAQTRAALGLPAGPPADGPALLLTVARLAPQKGLDLLLRAGGRLRDEGRDVVWCVAGEGPLREALEARIAAGGLPVRLLGRRSDLPELYQAADLVVSTAHWEGQPVALQEAQQAGAAIVATDVGGTRETLGDGARYVPGGDAAALADAIGHLLDNPKEVAELKQLARRQAQERPTEADLIAQLTTAYGSEVTGDEGSGDGYGGTGDGYRGSGDGYRGSGDGSV
jgi:glycosyltransferase involved in cell wall biosynthesis